MSVEEPLVILPITDRYEVGEIEQNILSQAKNPKPFKLIPCPLHISQPLSSIPDEVASQVHGIIIMRHFFTAQDIPRFPKLKVIVRSGVGYDRLDRKALAAAGVTVANTPDYGTTEVADHAVALAMSLRRGIILQHDFQRTPEASWISLDAPKISPPEKPLSRPIIQRPEGKIWGSIGLGRIGTAAALRAKAFGWKVIFYDPYVQNGVDRSLGVTRVRNVEELLKTADVISMHCNHTPETHLLINDKALSLVKPGSILINVARGEVVDLSAVERALREGRLAAAGLDCLEVEPIKEPVPPLIQAYRNREQWLMGRLVITPHVAYYSDESVEDIRTKSMETLRDILFDGSDANVIDPKSY